MKALPVQKLPEGGWIYEIKFDGYRALAFKNGKDVRLVSRNNKTFDYPELLDALKLLLPERVGTGFSDKVLASLYTKFQKLKVPSSPFVNLPEKSQGKWGLGITARGHETGASGLNLYWSFQKEFALTNSSRKPSWLISNIYVTTRISFNGRWMIRTIA